MKIYEEFNEYLDELTNGRFLIDEVELYKLNIPLDDKSPVAKRKKGSSYVDLYDYSDEMKFVTNENLSKFHGYSGNVKMFGVLPEEFSLVGYHIYYGKFYRVYDLREVLDKLSLDLLEKEEIKYPLANIAIFDEEDTFLEKAKKHIVGFVMDGNSPSPVINLKEMEEENGMIKFKSTEIEFPLVEKWYMGNFRNSVQYDKDQIKGYYLKYKQFRPVYNIGDILSTRTVVTPANDEWEVVVPVDDYLMFEKSMPTSYQRHLSLIGLTMEGHLLIRGPETNRFKEAKRKFEIQIGRD